MLDRVVVGPGRRQATAAVDVTVEGGETFLLETVDVFGQRIAGLPARLEERLEQRIRRRPPLQLQWALAAAVLVRAGETILHLLEVGQAVGIVPRRHTLIGGPPFVVERIAPLEDHPVDRRRSTEHLAPGVVDPTAAHERLGLGLVLPVVELRPDGERQRCRHVDEDIPLVVGSTRLEHQHPVRRIGREPVGQYRAGRTATDDHIVVPGGHLAALLVARSKPTGVCGFQMAMNSLGAGPAVGSRAFRRRSGCRVRADRGPLGESPP